MADFEGDYDLGEDEMDFVAIDVETANADFASICQIGIVVFESGILRHRWTTLVDPEDEFDGVNTSIHGIDEEAVRGAPTFPLIQPQIMDLLSGKITACHTPFDRVSLRRAHERYSLPDFECRWLDTARLVRRAWPQFRDRGYGLANVAAAFNIDFKHHDACEDARVCGEILVRALTDSGKTIDAWIYDLARRNPTPSIAREGDGDGPLLGEVMVFTGALSISRREAADLAAKAGCRVAPGVTKETTLLVVGDLDLRNVPGQTRSAKHRKAEALIHAGQSIRIIGESDFRRLIANEGESPIVEMSGVTAAG